MDSSKLKISCQDSGRRLVEDVNGFIAQPAIPSVKIFSSAGRTRSPQKDTAIRFQVPRWKRTLDLTCIALALPAWLPLMLLIAVVIKLGSAGPVLFKQERVGFRGQRFTILKFRTMRTGANTAIHEAYAARLMNSNLPMAKLDAKGDARLIAWGWLIRATGLDELAQIINVLRGEMSLVGPRPCLPSEYEHYRPWQKERFNALPGLTGLWQVNGKNRTTFDQMIHLDNDYARNHSLGLDLKIMLKTPAALGLQILESRQVGKVVKDRSQSPTQRAA